jgi:hypothetical protein
MNISVSKIYREKELGRRKACKKRKKKQQIVSVTGKGEEKTEKKEFTFQSVISSFANAL